jgi:maleylpyruvate isomerase
MVASVERLGLPDDLAVSSLLPGWTRAHVLVHLARNSDGLRNLLLGARTGEALRMYASPTTRDVDIAVGVTRPAEVIVADVLEASRRFLVDAVATPAELWPATVAFTSGNPNPPRVSVARIFELRLQEVEVHHVDLGVGYEFTDTPVQLAERLIAHFAALRAVQGVPLALRLEGAFGVRSSPTGIGALPIIRGSNAAALAWLAGRGSDGLRAEGDGPLPELPPL